MNNWVRKKQQRNTNEKKRQINFPEAEISKLQDSTSSCLLSPSTPSIDGLEDVGQEGTAEAYLSTPINFHEAATQGGEE